MKSSLLFTALFFVTYFSFSQKSSLAPVFAKLINPQDLRANLFLLASAEMEGRETATPGQRKAAAFIESYFSQLGLMPGNNGSFQLFYPVYKDSIAGSEVEVNGKPFERDKDFKASEGNISATQRFSEIVVLGTNVADSLTNFPLAGKVVLILSNGAGNYKNIRPLFNTILRKGVAAILIVDSSFIGSNNNRRGNTTVNLFKKSIAPQQYYISDNIARAIIGNEFYILNYNTIKTFSAEISLVTNKTTIILESSDVIGLLPGTDLKEEYVVVSAHYDHLGMHKGVIYYGADDDGSGTVSLMQIAKAFVKAKQAGKGPRRSIVFLANSGEEEGLWGSDYYTGHPTYPLSQTSVDLNIDMIGRIDPNRKNGDSTNYVYVVGDHKLSSELKPISEALNKKYTKLELDYKYNDPKDKEMIYYRSDHYNFAKKGIPIIFYFDGVHRDYHRPSDTPDKINYQLMTKRAKLIFYTAWEFANKSHLVKRDLPLN
ncbi:MAG: hypothetical protein NVS1B13_18700 [Flavisolibacter sp.]